MTDSNPTEVDRPNRGIEPAPTEKRNEILVLKNGKNHARLWEIHTPKMVTRPSITSSSLQVRYVTESVQSR